MAQWLDNFLSYAIPIGVVFIFAALFASAMPKVTSKIKEWIIGIFTWARESGRSSTEQAYTQVITYE